MPLTKLCCMPVKLSPAANAQNDMTQPLDTVLALGRPSGRCRRFRWQKLGWVIRLTRDSHTVDNANELLQGRADDGYFGFTRCNRFFSAVTWSSRKVMWASISGLSASGVMAKRFFS